MKLPLPLRLAGLAAGFSGFLAQDVLPAVHAWRVGPLEAAYHAAAPARAEKPTASPERKNRHEHHSEEGCGLCPLLARAEGAPPNSARLAYAAGTPVLALSEGGASPGGPSLLDAPPRGPPSVA